MQDGFRHFVRKRIVAVENLPERPANRVAKQLLLISDSNGRSCHDGRIFRLLRKALVLDHFNLQARAGALSTVSRPLSFVVERLAEAGQERCKYAARSSILISMKEVLQDLLTT